ncbi:MAG: sulfotransferase, partial [Gammaproteobacteria bacterium]|nr:sulfotransferase [Gammaproteobacteria bacterium]
IWTALGAALQLQSRNHEARACYEKAIALHPRQLDAHSNLGTVLQALRRIDEAAESFGAALRIDPQHLPALAGLAASLDWQGRYAEGLELLEPLVADGVEHPEVVLSCAQLLLHAGRFAEGTLLLERSLAGTATASARQRAHFLLADLYDALGRYDEAFTRYRLGNELKRLYFDPLAHRADVDAIIDVCTRTTLEALPHAQAREPAPIFIVGMPRSGTSLVEQILAAHSSVHAAGELELIPALAARLAAGGEAWPQSMRMLTTDALVAMAADFRRAAAFPASGIERVTDKTPGNFLFLGLVELLFPNARIVHCRRDPLDTCLSCYFQNFGGRSLPFSYELAHVGAYYREYERLMRHWREASGLPMLDVVYEDLIGDPERVSRVLVEFAGLEWQPRCLSFHEIDRPIATVSHAQVRKPIYTSSVGRHRHYEQYLGPLKAALGVAMSPSLRASSDGERVGKDASPGGRGAIVSETGRAGIANGREALAAGEVAGRGGDLHVAARHFERAIVQDPTFVAAHFNLGVCRAALGDLSAASGCFSRAAALAPSFAAAHERQGSVLNALGDYAGAAHSFRAALQLDPNNAQALAWLGASLQLAGNFDEAEACYRRALDVDAHNADAHCNLGKLCQMTDRPQEAARHLGQALVANPAHPAALAGLAMQLDREGRYGEALERLAPHASSLQPEIVIAHARALRRLGRLEAAAAGLEKLLGRPSLPLDALIQAHFSLGHACDAQGRYEAAFEHFREGNALKPAHYDGVRQIAATDKLMRVFDGVALERLPRSGNNSERPVFVLGMPRAGKSLVEQVLASHPQVAGAGELTILGSLATGMGVELARSWPECVPDLSEAMIARAAQSYLDVSEAAGGGAARILDTLPGNFVHLGLIELLFPHARVVHVTRDPADLALACWFKNFAGASLAFTFDLHDIAAYCAEYRRLMAHWRSVSKLEITDVSYEALVQGTEHVSRQLVGFLGLPWHGDCLRYFEPGVAKLAGAMPVREPLDAREVGRHAHYRDFVDLSAFDAARGEMRAGELRDR